MPLYFISELSRRIFLMPSSRRICEPVPMVKNAPELSLFGLRFGRARPKKLSRLSSMSSAWPADNSTSAPLPSRAMRCSAWVDDQLSEPGRSEERRGGEGGGG